MGRDRRSGCSMDFPKKMKHFLGTLSTPPPHAQAGGIGAVSTSRALYSRSAYYANPKNDAFSGTPCSLRTEALPIVPGSSMYRVHLLALRHDWAPRRNVNNISGFIEDEGRPLEVDLQGLASNRLVTNDPQWGLREANREKAA